MLAAEILSHFCKAGRLGGLTAGREAGVRRHDQAHPVGVVEQQTANESRQVIAVFDPFAKRGNHRLEIQCCHRIAIVCGGAKGS